MRILGVLAGLIALAPFQAFAEAGESWFEVKSEHFQVYTNLEEKAAVDLATDLERFRQTLAHLTGLSFEEDYSPPLTLYAYKERDQYIDRFDRRGTNGFYMTRPDGAVSVLSMEEADEEWKLSGIETLFHEYTHHLVHQYSPIDYPVWYDEGFAEFVSTMEFDGDKAIIGNPPIHRFITLREAGDWLSLEKILEAKGNYIRRMGPQVKRNPDRNKSGIPQQYAQGWLITHFFMNHDKYRESLNTYLHALNDSDVDPDEAFEEAFGVSYWEMDKKIHTYWSGYELPYFTADVSELIHNLPLRTRRLSDAEAAAVDFEARLRTNALEDKENAQEAFRTVLEEGTRPLEIRQNLTRLALRTEDWETAEMQIEAMLSEAPKHAPALTLKAEMMHDQIEADAPAKKDLQSVKQLCVKAIKADPTYVPALVTFARLHLRDALPVDSTVLKIVESIRFLAPDYRPGQVLEAQLLSEAGQYEDAVAAARKLIDWAPNRQMRRDYEDLLEEIQDKRAEAT